MIPRLKFFVSAPPTRANTLYHALSNALAGRSRDLSNILNRIYWDDDRDTSMSLEDCLLAFAREHGLDTLDLNCPVCHGAKHIYSTEILNEYREQQICEPCPLCNVWPDYVMPDADSESLPL